MCEEFVTSEKFIATKKNVMTKDLAERFVEGIESLSEIGRWKTVIEKDKSKVMELLNSLGEDVLKLNNNQREEILIGLEKDFDIEKVKEYARVEFSDVKMRALIKYIENGATKEELELLTKVYIPEQMQEIHLGFEQGLTKEEIEVYASLSPAQMRAVRRAYESGLKYEQLKLCNNVAFSVTQIEQIIKGFKEGLSIDQVKKYASPNLSLIDMLKSFHDSIKENENNTPRKELIALLTE